MPATFIITSQDAERAAEWSRQLPAAMLSGARGEALKSELLRPGARVWIRDVCDPESLAPAHPDTVIISIGEPKSVPFEESRRSPGNSYSLSYEESGAELRRIAPLAAELAQSRAVLSVVQSRQRRAEPSSPEASGNGRRAPDEFEFLAAAIGHLGDRTRVLEEFRRGVRSRVRSSRVTVFLREGRRFVADEGGAECPGEHELVQWLQEHAAIVDVEALEHVENPVAESAIRQKLGEWNSRLLVPLESEGAVEGWVVFGPRADGRPYSEADRDDSLMLVGVLSRLLAQGSLLRSALKVRHEVDILQKHGPRFRILYPDATMDETLPVEVREVASIALRQGQRVEREFGRLCVTAGPVREGGGCWVCWDESAFNTAALARKAEAERHQVLHDLGIMISHELANAMFSVSTYFQHVRRQREDDEAGYPLMESVNRDLERMKAMPQLLSTLFEMSKQPTGLVDLKRVVQSVAKEVGGVANVPEVGPVIWGHERYLSDALVWLCREVIETKDRSELAAKDVKLAITLQQRGKDKDMICLMTISYPGLRVEQIKVGEATSAGEYPTVPVYLAREVFRFHYGSVHVGQGQDGPELMISVRSRRVNALSEVEGGQSGRPEGASASPFVPPAGSGSGDPEAFPASA
jgi:hypothetical protein